MTRVKIVKGFYTEAVAKRVEAAERKLAKAEGRGIVSIDIEDACLLYNKSQWFKTKIQKFGRPVPGQVVVVVYYTDTAGLAAQVVPSVVTLIKDKVAAVVVKVKGLVSKISKGAATAKVALIELATIYNTHMITSASQTLELRRYSRRLAA